MESLKCLLFYSPTLFYSLLYPAVSFLVHSLPKTALRYTVGTTWAGCLSALMNFNQSIVMLVH